MNTAEKIYKDIITLPMAERERLFSLIARKGFDKGANCKTHNSLAVDTAETTVITSNLKQN